MSNLKVNYTVRVNKAQYDVTVDYRGAIEVTHWTPSPKWPVICSVDNVGICIESGVVLPLPDCWWVKDAVVRWNKVKANMWFW